MNKKQSVERKATLSNAHKDFEKGLNIYAFFKMRDRVISEDLVQDTFMKTWIYLAKGGKINLMKAFLYHILNNLIVDQYRKRKTTSLDLLIESGFDEPNVDDSKKLFNILDGKTAILLIKRLPKAYHELMNMKYVQNLSIKEMSTVTGQSKNAVSVHLHRGLSKLRLLYR